MILSQTNILNIFPASVALANVQKFLEGVCNRKTRKYIPQSPLWISRLFIELANRNDRVCLTLDCSGVNFQTCYFNPLNASVTLI